MKSVYFYYKREDWISICTYLQSLELDLYTYRGEKLDFNELFNGYLNGKWYVLVPSKVTPIIDKNGQIDEYTDAMPFHTISRSGAGLLPATIFCNEGEIVGALFKRIKKYFVSNYKKADSGKEYISAHCYQSWLQYEVNLAGLVKFFKVESAFENSSFKQFVEYFQQKGYVICDPYQRVGEALSLKEYSYIITIPEAIHEDKLIMYSDGIEIRKKSQKGRTIYTFTMDYRHMYHCHEKILRLYNDIKAYCNVNL